MMNRLLAAKNLNSLASSSIRFKATKVKTASGADFEPEKYDVIVFLFLFLVLTTTIKKLIFLSLFLRASATTRHSK